MSHTQTPPLWTSSLLERRAAAKPGSAPLQSARELLDRGEHEAALNLIAEALERQPGCAEAYKLRGCCHAACGDHQRAQADFDRACALDSEDPEAFALRGRLAHGAGRLDAARRDFERAESLGAGATAVTALGRVLLALGMDFEATETWGRAYARDPRQVEALAQRGQVYMTHELYVAALADFSTCCLVQPETANHWVQRGNAFYELGDFELAVRDYEAALSLDAALPEVSLNLGCIALDEDDPQRAIRHLDEALRQNDAYARAWLNRGLAYLHHGNLARAEADLDRAQELDPGDPDAPFALARLHATQRRYRLAADQLVAALERAPEYVFEALDDQVFEEVRKLREVKRAIALAQEYLPG